MCVVQILPSEYTQRGDVVLCQVSPRVQSSLVVFFFFVVVFLHTRWCVIGIFNSCYASVHLFIFIGVPAIGKSPLVGT